MSKKEKAVEEVTTSAGGAHAVNKFRVSDFVMMAVIVILCATCVLPFIHVAAKSISGGYVKIRIFLAQGRNTGCL